MPKVTDEYRTLKRAEIADAAMRAFQRKGFHAASMADIITESGLSAGAIYGHFSSKNEIVLEVASKVIGTRIDQVEELAAQTPMPLPAALLRVVSDGLLRDVGRPEMLVQLWGEAITDPGVKDMAAELVGRLRAVYRSYISRWHQRIHTLTPADADTLAADQVDLFLSCIQGFILQSALLPDFDREAFFASMEAHLPR